MSHHLVTGGAGFIGSALVRRLLLEGHEVTVLDRLSRGKATRVPSQARTIKGDVREEYDVRLAARGCDVVWHLAYVQGTQTFYADPKNVVDVALRGIMNVLGACAVMETKPELFLVSSSEVYQVPPPGMFPTAENVPLSVPDVTNARYSYGAGKIASEVATLAYAQAGLLGRAVIVRPHNVYGPDMGHDHVIPQFAERMQELMERDQHEFTIQGTGLETRSFCFIEDCVDGLIVLLEHGEDRGVYHLGNPYEEITIRDLAHAVASWFGWEAKVVPGALPKGSPTRRAPDVGKLAALGYEPRVMLAEGLGQTLDWYSSRVSA